MHFRRDDIDMGPSTIPPDEIGGVGDDDDAMSAGTFSVFWFPQVYWIFVGSVIAAFAVKNMCNQFTYRQRLSAARNKRAYPAKPQKVIPATVAVSTAILREISNASPPTLHITKSLRLRVPSLGPSFLVLAQTVLLIVLVFYDFDTRNHAVFETIAYRAGFVSLGQLPLIFLLAGKNNLIGLFTGHSYERLHYLHRWTARTLLLTTTFHLAYWLANWAPDGYFAVRNDITVRSGLSAWALLIWIVTFGWAPVRNWRYEIYVVQHIVFFIAFTVMILIHTPSDDHVWIWIGVAFFLFDRLLRTVFVLITNFSLFHPRRRHERAYPVLLTCHAQLTPLANNTTRVTIPNPPLSWRPGQHIYVSLPTLTPLQTHPFTIASLPSDNALEFLIRAHTGSTLRLLSFAQENGATLPSPNTAKSPTTVPATLDGPYGNLRPLSQFDTVILLAGGAGAAFTMPLLRDLVARWKEGGNCSTLLRPAGYATRRVRFVWAVRTGEQVGWFEEQLLEVLEEVRVLRESGKDLQCHISVYITRDDKYVGDRNSARRPLSPGPRASRFVEGWGDVVEKGGMEAQKEVVGSGEEESNMGETNIIGVQNYNNDEEKKGYDSTTTSDALQAPLRDEKTKALVDSAIKDITPSPAHTCATTSSHPYTYSRPNIALLTSRPHPRTIIRRSLERAAGETAVVSCGPGDMNDDVRRTVVSLSDERAVMRGTGALGVWFWGEGFGLG